MPENNQAPMGPRERRRRQQNPHLRPKRNRPWVITLLILLAFLGAGAAAWTASRSQSGTPARPAPTTGWTA